jgi:hypothetical protein
MRGVGVRVLRPERAGAGLLGGSVRVSGADIVMSEGALWDLGPDRMM